MHAIANIPAECLRASVARFRRHCSLPRNLGRVGFRITLFETCSAFTHVTACMLAKSPQVTLTPKASVAILCNCSDCYRLERQLPGGIRTYGDAVPFHGAREVRASSLAERLLPCTFSKLAVNPVSLRRRSAAPPTRRTLLYRARNVTSCQ
jgi:hypothetical protein